MAGVILSDSLSVAKAVAECRVRDRRQSGMPCSARRRRRRVASLIYRPRAAIFVMLDGKASLATAGSQLVASSSVGTASWHLGYHVVILAMGRFFVPRGGYFSMPAGFMLHGSRV